MTADVHQLYEHLKTLNKQWFYDKSEIDTTLSDYIEKSETSGLVKNDGTIDTTAYITSASLPTKTSDLTNDGSSSSDALTFIETSATSGLVKNDGTIDTTTYLSEHQDISGKANSSDLATVATSGSYTDLQDIPETFAPSSHEHAASEIVDSNAYTNLQTSANSTQAAINSAIDSKIGSLLSVELIEVTTSLGTASASTMDKLYLVAESTSATNDNYEIFVTVKTGTSGNYSYAWEKVDTARIDLSGYASSTHTHGNLTNDGKIGSTANYFVYTSTGGAVAAKEKIGNITTSGAIGTSADKVVVTTTSGVLTTSDMVTEIDGVINSLISYGNSL
ncbi:MAG: hypothetical protein IJF83_06170 [Methanobrevibacter sp.]|nr:hypothetical protein [Methanobrevibacter sp.]